MTIREQIQAALAAEVTVEDRDLDRQRFPDPETARAAAARRARGRMVHRIKAGAVADAFRDHPGRAGDGSLTVRSRRGEVRLSRVELVELPDGNSCVEVWTGGAAGPPQFRIFNPPMLAEDPRGEVRLDGPAGRVRRLREDPLAALADVIAGGGR